jgi:surfeit locus 1 family protein
VKTRSRQVVLAILAAALVLTALGLGRWQLSRAQQKIAMQAEVERQAAVPALSNQLLLQTTHPETSIYQRARLRGAWVQGQTVLLDNRPMDGRVGFYVVTPFMLEGSQTAIMVQRGWVARNFVDRTAVPSVSTQDGVFDIEGRITPPPAALYELGAQPGGAIRQNIDLKQFAQQAQLALLTSVSLQQSGPPDAGLLRNWPAVNLGVDKHYGYAFQWFALAALVAGLYAWFQIVRPRISRHKD